MIPVFDDTATFIWVAYSLTIFSWVAATLGVLQRTRTAKRQFERTLGKKEYQDQ